MKLPIPSGLPPALLQRAGTALQAQNGSLAHFGLFISPQQAQALVQGQAAALQAAGRVEFGEGILPRMAFAFCNSPYVAPGTFTDILSELTEIFYYFKTESGEQLTDDELLENMKAAYDGPCGGHIPYLRETLLEELARSARLGGGAAALPAEEAEEEAPDE